VTGSPPVGGEVEATDESHYFGAELVLSLQKLTNDEDAGTPPGPHILVGQPVTWTYVVTNGSNVALSNIVVTDSQGIDVDCEPSVLEPGQWLTCAAHGTSEPGQYANTGAVIGIPPGGLSAVTATDDSHYYGADPRIELEKLTNGQDADDLPGAFVEPGDPVTWTYMVENAGNVGLVNVTVRDDGGTPDESSDDLLVCTFDALEPTTWRACTLTATATATNQYTNVATTTAFYEGLEYWDSDVSHYSVRYIIYLPLLMR
jgi:hypothetical protein